MSTEQSLDPQLVEHTRQQIRGLVNEIAQLSKSEVSPEEFYATFLPKVVSALAAVGGVVWTTEDQGRLAPAYQMNLQETKLGESEENWNRHGRLIHQVLTSGEAMLVPPHSGAGDESEATNPTEFLLVLGVLKTDLEVVGVVEVFQRSDSGPATQKGYQRFLTQMCDLASDFFKSRKLKHFSDRQVMWTQLEEFTRSVHASLDPRETAYTIANEGRRLIECDRVSIAIARGRRCRIEAVSGQDLFDKRSNTVRLLGQLATAVVSGGEPVWYKGDTSNMAPQVEDAVQEYVDESHSKMVAVLPLYPPLAEPTDDKEELAQREDKPVAVGALIVEKIEDVRVPEKMLQRVDVVAEHSSTALANSLEHNNLFLLPVWRLLGKTKLVLKARTLPKTMAIAAAVLAVALGLVFVPKGFKLQGKGLLEPVDRRDVFAGIGGVVREVLVDHRDLVSNHPIASAETSADGAEILAIITDDTASADIRYNLLSVPRGNGLFVTSGVEPGDTVHLALKVGKTNERDEADDSQAPDDRGGLEILVAEVVDENTIRLARDLALPIREPKRIEIWRTTLLARLDDTDLSVEIARVLGERDTVQKEIARIQRALSDRRGRTSSETDDLFGRKAQEETRLLNLDSQLALYALKERELSVKSPVDGQVITWDLYNLLIGRPVQRGQVLMRIADPDGPWQLEVEMPETRMGHIGRAQNALREEVRLKLRTHLLAIWKDRLNQAAQESSGQTIDQVTLDELIELIRRHFADRLAALPDEQLHLLVKDELARPVDDLSRQEAAELLIDNIFKRIPDGLMDNELAAGSGRIVPDELLGFLLDGELSSTSSRSLRRILATMLREEARRQLAGVPDEPADEQPESEPAEDLAAGPDALMIEPSIELPPGPPVVLPDEELDARLTAMSRHELLDLLGAIFSDDFDDRLVAEYILATDSSTKRYGKVEQIDLSAEVRGEEGNTVLIKVDIDADELKAELPQLRPGASVDVKVDCGTRPIGYVWFHDAIAFVQARIIFRWFD